MNEELEKAEIIEEPKSLTVFPPSDNSQKIKEEIISWVKTIVGTLVFVFVCINFIFRPVEVQGMSMNPTLADGQRIIVWQLFYTPSPSDIIVLEHTDGYLHVKRIIGVPGDHIDYIDSQMIINNELVNEPYIMQEPSRNSFYFEDVCQIRNSDTDCDYIPEGYFLVLGDNRNRSGDSREYGLVHESQIMGRAILRFFPFTNVGILR